jgi:hypothetical protein
MDKGKSELYDIEKDPSQKENIAVKNPELVIRLQKDYDKWFEDVTKNLNYERRSTLSRRGIELPTYEATLTDGVKFKEGHGWVHDWAAKWTSAADSLYWDVDCNEAQTYAIAIRYQSENQLSNWSLNLNGQMYPFQIRNAFKANELPSPDRVPRKEVIEMSDWGRQRIGFFNFKKGKNRIVIKPTKNEYPMDFDLKSIRLVLTKNEK